jgi:hypothetical protein
MSAKVSNHFPAAWRDELLHAMSYGWIGARIAGVNRVTDAMAAVGVVRPRTDTSRAAEWDAGRQVQEALGKARKGARK